MKTTTKEKENDKIRFVKKMMEDREGEFVK